MNPSAPRSRVSQIALDFALCDAIKARDNAWLAQLLELGANPNTTTADRVRDYDSPLHAAVWTENDEAVRLLLRYGADPTVFNQAGNTPLHEACKARMGQLQMVRVLLEGGANPDQPDAFGATPLKWEQNTDPNYAQTCGLLKSFSQARAMGHATPPSCTTAPRPRF